MAVLLFYGLIGEMADFAARCGRKCAHTLVQLKIGEIVSNYHPKYNHKAIKSFKMSHSAGRF